MYFFMKRHKENDIFKFVRMEVDDLKPLPGLDWYTKLEENKFTIEDESNKSDKEPWDYPFKIIRTPISA